MFRSMRPETLAAIVGILVGTSLGSALDAKADGHVTRIDGQIAGTPYSLFRPDNWNGDLVLLVHGSIPSEFEALAPGLAAQGFGVAFATLEPGLGEGSALKAITISTRRVEAQFTAQLGQPQKTYLLGFSRGAHNMVQLVETTPTRYDGMLSICGGNGGPQLAWNHFFTARVLFDYYFPGVLPGTALEVPDLDLDNFFSSVAPEVINAIMMDPLAAAEMASVDQYALAYDDFGELASGILQSLAIHSIGVNDLLRVAHGNPFENIGVIYTGTTDDLALNAGVTRLQSNPAARQYLQAWYEPTGSIGDTRVLLVHTSRDPVVPQVLHNDRFVDLVNNTGSSELLVRRVVDRFGHCNFTPEEIGASFAGLVTWVETGIEPSP